MQYANTLLKHKVLFGSDYPLITPDRWLADFQQIAIKSEVRPLILKENAVKVLRLDVDPATDITLLDPSSGEMRTVIKSVVQKPWGIEWATE